MNEAVYEIQAVAAGNLADVNALLLKFQQSPIEWTPQDLLSIHVARDETGRIVGAARLDKAGSRGVLHSVAIAPGHQGRGVGTRLLAQCEASALVAGITEIYLLAAAGTDFFARMAYQEVSRKVIPAAVAAHPHFSSNSLANSKCLGKIL